METQNALAVLAVDDPVARRYLLRTMGHEIEADIRDKGRPGDTVVLWPKRRCPVIVRRLAQIEPYPSEAVGPAGPALLSDRFYFADLETGSMYDVAFKKVAAIHKVIGGLS